MQHPFHRFPSADRPFPDSGPPSPHPLNELPWTHTPLVPDHFCPLSVCKTSLVLSTRSIHCSNETLMSGWPRPQEPPSSPRKLFCASFFPAWLLGLLPHPGSLPHHGPCLLPQTAHVGCLVHSWAATLYTPPPWGLARTTAGKALLTMMTPEVIALLCPLPYLQRPVPEATPLGQGPNTLRLPCGHPAGNAEPDSGPEETPGKPKP